MGENGHLSQGGSLDPKVQETTATGIQPGGGKESQEGSFGELRRGAGNLQFSKEKKEGAPQLRKKGVQRGRQQCAFRWGPRGSTEGVPIVPELPRGPTSPKG